MKECVCILANEYVNELEGIYLDELMSVKTEWEQRSEGKDTTSVEYVVFLSIIKKLDDEICRLYCPDNVNEDIP